MAWIPEVPVRTPPFARHRESRKRSCPGSSTGQTSSKHESQHSADSTGLPGSAQQSWARHSEQGSTVHPVTPPVSRHGASQTTTNTRPKSPSSNNRSEEKHTITVSQSASSEVPASSQGPALSAVPATSSDPTDADRSQGAGPAGDAIPAVVEDHIRPIPAMDGVQAGVAEPYQPILAGDAVPARDAEPSRSVPAVAELTVNDQPAQPIDPASLDQDEVPAPDVSSDSGSTLFQSIPKTFNQADLLDILTMMTMIQRKGVTPDMAPGPATVSSPGTVARKYPSHSLVRRSHSPAKTFRYVEHYRFESSSDSRSRSRFSSMEDDDSSIKRISSAQYQLFRQAVTSSKGSFKSVPFRSK